MKIKTIRLECQVCSKISSTQLFYNSAGELRYARCRHYIDQLNGKPKFGYHQQSLEYVMDKIGKAKNSNCDLSQNGHIDQTHTEVSIDLDKLKLSLDNGNTRNVKCGCRLVWFRTLAFLANDPGFKSRRPHHLSFS
jgi:hypothetical protein